jgi:hypothetical protein
MLKPALPNVGSAVLAWAQPLEFVLIGKEREGFRTAESEIACEIKGVWMPLKPQELSFKPEGQRAWQWRRLHAVPPVTLQIDDVVSYCGTRYRVMSKMDFSDCGYVEYDLVQDFQTAC